MDEGRAHPAEVGDRRHRLELTAVGDVDVQGRRSDVGAIQLEIQAAGEGAFPAETGRLGE